MKHHKLDSEQIFIPILDWWLAVAVGMILLMIALSIPAIIWQDMSLATTLVAIPALIIAFLLVIDRVFFTRYVIQKEGLAVQGQLRKTFFPYRSMVKIQNGSFLDLFSTSSKKRFALSANCLVISLRGEIAEKISVSPKRKQEFLNLLLEKIDEERNHRTSHTRHKV